MHEVYVVNCRPHNWDACEKETIFGLKLGRKLPPLERGDIVLVRLSGVNCGVKSIWYFERAINVDENVDVPWKDASYGWILKCKPIAKLPRVFSEGFIRTTSPFSTKIPNFPAIRIQPSIVPLKNFEAKAYLEHILKEFGNDLQGTIDYMGERRSVKKVLEEILVHYH